MTLLKQLVSILLILISAVILGTLWLTLSNLKSFVTAQLSAHSQDTATSLALSLQKPIQEQDQITVERMIDAIFNSGFYQTIKLEDMQGKVIYQQNSQENIFAVPTVLTKLFPVITPKQSAIVKSGWSNAGTLWVQSHPGYAENIIWQLLQSIMVWYVVFLGICFLLAMIAVQYILRPLKSITKQANAICERQFIINHDIPGTHEFKIVIDSMNHMSNKLKKMFSDFKKSTEEMREKAYKDAITGLGNRRYFNAQLKYMLSVAEYGSGGGLVLLRLTNLKEYKLKWSEEAGVVILRLVTKLLRDMCQDYTMPILGHLGGGDFVIAVLNVEPEELDGFANDILLGISDLDAEDGAPNAIVSHIGIAQFGDNIDQSQVLSNADYALRKAFESGDNCWYRYRADEVHNYYSDIDWVQFLKESVKARNLSIYQQPVMLEGNSGETQGDLETYHQELLMRLKGPGGYLLSAGLFLPIAECLELTVELDRMMVQKSIRHIDALGDTSTHFALNLSVLSIKSNSYVGWLVLQLKNMGQLCHNISFELPEYAVKEHLPTVKNFIDKVKPLGIKIGLDHFGCGFSSFAYLDELRIDYIKIDGSYVAGCDQNDDNQYIIRSFANIGHSLDMLVLATGVETEQERLTLLHLGVDGYQGHLLARPEVV